MKFPEQKVVRNDHVLAIVRIKEEELEREEQAQKRQKLIDDELEHDSDETDENESTRLTRLKAKELKQLPLPLAPVLKPDENLVALVHEEFHSDDDDEEYQRCDEDLEVS